MSSKDFMISGYFLFQINRNSFPYTYFVGLKVGSLQFIYFNKFNIGYEYVTLKKERKIWGRGGWTTK